MKGRITNPRVRPLALLDRLQLLASLVLRCQLCLTESGLRVKAYFLAIF